MALLRRIFFDPTALRRAWILGFIKCS
jgi:hypothetical protein